MKYLNFLRRLIATGFSFAIFGIGALFVTFIIFPPVIFLSKEREAKRRRIREIVKYTFGLFIFMMKSLGLLDIGVDESLRNLDLKSSLIIANHPTLIDVVILISIFPDTTCIVKKDLWDNFFIRGIVKAAGYIANDEVDVLLKSCKNAFSEEQNLIVFPEGTRTRQGKRPIFKRGAAHIAIDSGVDVQLIGISCSPRTLAKGVPWYQIPKEKPQFKITNLGKITNQDIIELNEVRSLAARELTDQFYGYYSSL